MKNDSKLWKTLSCENLSQWQWQCHLKRIQFTQSWKFSNKKIKNGEFYFMKVKNIDSIRARLRDLKSA